VKKLKGQVTFKQYKRSDNGKKIKVNKDLFDQIICEKLHQLKI